MFLLVLEGVVAHSSAPPSELDWTNDAFAIEAALSRQTIFLTTGPLYLNSSECQFVFRKMTYLYTRAIGSFIGMPFGFSLNQFSCEVWSSLNEEPQSF